ncbi:hypothetical protein ATE84_2314 [Aquimarina sp. MAR_2010_214]|uniref:hypothetical protein n=1 Tax=Aquimarina sp. MAR_2010_214 TaxID=1250026 RepID=UPI000C70A787|nr:hypothetical protein [Aquimarina sp. MAR_2010_214]PKV50259.1 hypothetical protein ATE84_2314 [Aquimarina sp. MAR_2010_214]
MKFKTIMLWVCCIIISHIEAQENNNSFTKNTLSLTTGLNSGYLNDANYSPLNYTHKGIFYGLTYTRTSNAYENIFGVLVDYYNTTIKTDASTKFDSDFTIGNINISYLQKAKEYNMLKLYLGGELQANFNYTNYNNKDSYSFIAAHSINLASAILFSINEKQTLYTSISIPIATLLVQPPYNSFDEKLQENENRILKLLTDGNLVTINKYYAINWNAKYQYLISKEFSLFLRYQLFYQKASKTHILRQLQNQLAIGINYNF